MTDQFVDANKMVPITPPPELVQQWIKEATGPDYEQVIATQAARWSADQELEACCKWLSTYGHTYEIGLRAARRPKPPSLKEQALEAMSRFDGEMWCEEMEADLAIIRTALESLPS